MRSGARISIARIVLAAMLFSVASPTFAALIFQGRADVSARILGLQSQDRAPRAAAAPQETEHHDCHEASGADPKGDEHAAHGVYCSFCLTGASHAVLVAAPVTEPVAVRWLATEPLPRADVFHALYFPSAYDSRGPPALSR